MPLSLKLPLGLRPSYCSSSFARLHAHLRGQQIGLLEDGSAFADGDDVVFGAIKRQQFAEAPDAGKIEPARHCRALGAPAMLEKAQGSWGGESLFQS